MTTRSNRAMAPAVFLSAAVVVALASAAAAYDYGDYRKYNSRNTTAPYLKCAGEENKPFVLFKPCTDGYVCMKNPDAKEWEWGLFCLPATGDDTCYAPKERCEGAPGKPYVLHKPCCGLAYTCKESEALGWGKFCLKAGFVMTAGTDAATPPDTAPPAPKAHYNPRTAPPPPAQPTCAAGWAPCGGMPYIKCCSSRYYCSGRGTWAGRCLPIPTAPPATQAPTQAPPQPPAAQPRQSGGYYSYGYGYGRPHPTRPDPKTFCPFDGHRRATTVDPTTGPDANGVFVRVDILKDACGNPLNEDNVSAESAQALVDAVCAEARAFLASLGFAPTRCALIFVESLSDGGTDFLVEVAAPCRPADFPPPALPGFPPFTVRVLGFGSNVCVAPSPGV